MVGEELNWCPATAAFWVPLASLTGEMVRYLTKLAPYVNAGVSRVISRPAAA